MHTYSTARGHKPRYPTICDPAYANAIDCTRFYIVPFVGAHIHICKRLPIDKRTRDGNAESRQPKALSYGTTHI